MFLELSVASPSYWVNSEISDNSPRLCGPQNEVTWSGFQTRDFQRIVETLEKSFSKICLDGSLELNGKFQSVKTEFRKTFLLRLYDAITVKAKSISGRKRNCSSRGAIIFKTKFESRFLLTWIALPRFSLGKSLSHTLKNRFPSS